MLALFRVLGGVSLPSIYFVPSGLYLLPPTSLLPLPPLLSPLVATSLFPGSEFADPLHVSARSQGV